MMFHLYARALGAFFLAASACSGAVEAASSRSSWATLQSERHGYRIGYPQDVFAPRQDMSSDEGLALFSRDGKAQLLVGAFSNDEATSIRAYRDYILQESYPGAAIDYAPMRGRWFVISGTIGDRELYERVSFTCGGRLINSWAMIYPVAERGFYNRVVEAVARSYSPGRECE